MLIAHICQRTDLVLRLWHDTVLIQARLSITHPLLRWSPYFFNSICFFLIIAMSFSFYVLCICFFLFFSPFVVVAVTLFSMYYTHKSPSAGWQAAHLTTYLQCPLSWQLQRAAGGTMWSEVCWSRAVLTRGMLGVCPGHPGSVCHRNTALSVLTFAGASEYFMRMLESVFIIICEYRVWGYMKSIPQPLFEGLSIV